MAHLPLSRTATELTVVDLMTLAARPNCRIAMVDIVAGSPKFNMVMSDPDGRRKWKVVGMGMTPPPVGTTMVSTLEVVAGDGQILPGDRLTSIETGYRDGTGNGDAPTLSHPSSLSNPAPPL
jgi:hypothetical protein